MATGGGPPILKYGSEEILDFSCSPCSADGRHVEAVKYCVDCSESMCSKCFSDHNRFAKMRAHRTLDKSAVKSLALRKTAERCLDHQDHPVDVFCRQHDAVCCSVCVSLDHRDCEGTTNLSNAAKGFRKSKEYTHVKDLANKTQKELTNVKKKREEDFVRLKKEAENKIEEIHLYTEQMIKHLEDLQKRTIDIVMEMYEEVAAKIAMDIKSLDGMAASTERTIKNIEKSSRDETALFIRSKQGRKNLAEAGRLLDETKSLIGKESIYFRLDIGIHDFLKRRDVLGSKVNNGKQRNRKGLSGPEVAERLKIGLRVVRGEDWEYADQDGPSPGPGNVTRIHNGGGVDVKWESGGWGTYRMGRSGRYDLLLADI